MHRENVGTVPGRLFTVIILFGIEVVIGGGIHERLELTHVHLLSKCGKFTVVHGPDQVI
jgi:hypothetical protein